MKKIILSGYMASGKTTIAQLLSKASGIPHIDLDEVIEKKAGKTITELFADGGEVKFRKLEHDVLHEVVNRDEAVILSLGGGTPCYANNHEVLKREDVISIYLKAGIGVLVQRIKLQGKERPLLAKLPEDELYEFIAKHLFDRSYFYMQSRHIVNTEGKKPEDIVNEIMSLF